MKVAFDEELNSDDIETLRKLLVKLRNPVSMTNTFAFSHYHSVTQPHQLHMKVKEKNASLKYDFCCFA
jgi:myotubularin-related protein 5/13